MKNSESLIKVGNTFKTALGLRVITKVTTRRVYTTDTHGVQPHSELIKDVELKITTGHWNLVQPKETKKAVDSVKPAAKPMKLLKHADIVGNIKLSAHEKVVYDLIIKEGQLIRNEMPKMKALKDILSCRGAADSLAKKGLVRKLALKNKMKVAGKPQIAFSMITAKGRKVVA